MRAYNSVGASAYSNAVNVTTPDVPPPPPAVPTSVAAGNNGDGTALVSWGSGSTNTASFEVRREKWDSRKRRMDQRDTAATVPSSVTSIVDSTGAGTYRYFVRATNAGGSSAYVGLVSVTITSISSSSKKPAPGRNK